MAWEVWNRMRAAAIAARRAFLDPTSLDQNSTDPGDREAIYRERLAYATSSAYDDLDAWARRYTTYGLYSKTRGIYNPTARLCEFNQSTLYPGMIPQGDESIPEFAREALPMGSGVPPELRSAILQVAQWTNLQTQKDELAFLGSALGDVGLEVVDDFARGKVTFKLWWPGYVKQLELDTYGNCQFVSLRYQTENDNETFEYRIDMAKESIATYKDDRPYDYDHKPESGEKPQPERPNPYGFVPFNWVRHYPLLSKYSDPAMRSTGKLDELNSLVSRTVDYIRTRILSPQGIAADWDPKGLGNIDARGSRSGSGSDENGSAIIGGGDNDKVFLIALPAGASGIPLAGNIEPEQAIPFIDHMLTELEADYPQLSAWAKLREMSSVSGIAIERALGDTAGRVYRMQAAYDQQLVKALQMAVAIGGWRLRMGETWKPTVARQKFAPFNLESYAAGDLDFMLLPRPLTPPTETERFEAKSTKYKAIADAKAAGIPFKDALLEAGYSEDDADRYAKEAEEKDARASQAVLNARASNLRRLGEPPTGPGESDPNPPQPLLQGV